MIKTHENFTEEMLNLQKKVEEVLKKIQGNIDYANQNKHWASVSLEQLKKSIKATAELLRDDNLKLNSHFDDFVRPSMFHHVRRSHDNGRPISTGKIIFKMAMNPIKASKSIFGLFKSKSKNKQSYKEMVKDCKAHISKLDELINQYERTYFTLNETSPSEYRAGKVK